MNRLTFTAVEETQLKRAAIDSYPNECCGLLIGEDAPDGGLRVTRVVPSANVDPNGGARAFEIDPALLLHWQKRTRGTTERILGHYHSHPDEAAEPSRTDLDRAWEPGQIWLIMAVLGGLPEQGVIGPLVGPMQAFRYAERDSGRVFEPVDIVTA